MFLACKPPFKSFHVHYGSPWTFPGSVCCCDMSVLWLLSSCLGNCGFVCDAVWVFEFPLCFCALHLGSAFKRVCSCSPQMLCFSCCSLYVCKTGEYPTQIELHFPPQRAFFLPSHFLSKMKKCLCGSVLMVSLFLLPCDRVVYKLYIFLEKEVFNAGSLDRFVLSLSGLKLLEVCKCITAI